MTQGPPPTPGGGPAPPPPAPATPPVFEQPPPPVPDHGRALLHDTEATRTYPCSNCGSQLVFGIAQQKLHCPSCGHLQELAEGLDRQVIENDLRQAIAGLRAKGAEVAPLVAGEKEVVCQNCGGHTTFTGTLTATRCPYCATPIQRDDVHDAPARLPVDGVLPFAIDDRAGKAAVEEWINSRWFAPSEFKQYSSTGSFQSVYLAYYTYDADTHTWYRGERGDTHTRTVGSGDNRRTETYTVWRNASGQVHNAFDDLPVLANEGLDLERVQALEPWPTQQVRPFSAEYLAGHLARTYDHDVEQGFGAAKQRMEAEITSTVRRDIGGDQQRIHQQDTQWGAMTFKHLLLPVWLLTVIYAGNPFQVFINGVTGEVQGDRPYSKVKIAFAIVLALIVIGVLVTVFRR